jgi:hypothetical protein
VPFRVDYSDNGTIRRRVFTFERKARFLSSTPEHKFPDSGARGIDRHHRLALWFQVFVEGLNNQELAILKRIVLNRSDYRTDYSRELHVLVQSPMSNIRNLV